MKKLQWHTVQKQVKSLIPQEINPRVITDKQMSALKRSLKKYGLVEIPALDIDGKILAGHQRIKALHLLGRSDEIIDVRIPNRKLTDDEAKQYLIASNSLGGAWDFEKLKSFKLDLLTDLGFNKSELLDIWDEHLEVRDEDWNEEAEIKKAQKTKIKAGDRFALGKHRLICADALNPGTVKKLLGNTKVDMVDIDPPFNINLSYNKGIGNKKNYGGTTNDNKTDDEYRLFIKTLMQNALSVIKPNAHCLFWCDERWVWLFQILYKELGIDSKRLLIWLKNNSSPTPQTAFNKIAEFCVYGTIGSPYLNKNVTNLHEVMNKGISTGNNVSEEILDQLNVWLVKRLPSNQYEHPTQKSPSLHEKALRRCTRPGDVVLDLTAGSGSIMSACEQLKRVAYMCEYEPIFCQVILSRYKSLTGLNPIKI